MKLSRYAVITGLLLSIPSVWAENTANLDPVDLMSRVEAHASSPDEVVTVAMKLMDAGGKESSRTAKFYQKKIKNNDDMKLIRFDTPPEMSDSAVLTIENAARSDDQWIYLPAYHTSRKIPASGRSDRYMGTDFFYEDVSDDEITHYKYQVIGREEADGRSLVVIEQVPIEEDVKKDSAYGKKIQWVDPDKLLVSRIDFFNKENKLIKRYSAKSPLKVGAYWRWQEALMEDLGSGHKTQIQYSEHKIEGGLENSLFTIRSLERGR